MYNNSNLQEILVRDRFYKRYCNVNKYQFFIKNILVIYYFKGNTYYR